MEKVKFDEYIYNYKIIDIFFCIGEERVYAEESRFNIEDEGKKTFRWLWILNR